MEYILYLQVRAVPMVRHTQHLQTLCLQLTIELNFSLFDINLRNFLQGDNLIYVK